MKIDTYSDAVKCDLCDEIAKNLSDAHAHCWDWFTGCLLATFHVCPQCQSKNRSSVLAKRQEAGIKGPP